MFRARLCLCVPHVAASARYSISGQQIGSINLHSTMVSGHMLHYRTETYRLLTDMPSFSFLRFLGMSAAEAHALFGIPTIRRQLTAMQKDKMSLEDDPLFLYVCHLT